MRADRRALRLADPGDARSTDSRPSTWRLSCFPLSTKRTPPPARRPAWSRPVSSIWPARLTLSRARRRLGGKRRLPIPLDSTSQSLRHNLSASLGSPFAIEALFLSRLATAFAGPLSAKFCPESQEPASPRSRCVSLYGSSRCADRARAAPGSESGPWTTACLPEADGFSRLD
jgi:hypothetical protein